MNATFVRWCVAAVICFLPFAASAQGDDWQIGREVAIPRHLQDGEEYQITIPQLVVFGEKLFTAKWTIQEGQGRPNTKGTGPAPPLSNPSEPLIFPRNFNRISGPDANSCSGCHNEPFVGGGGDHVTDVFVLGQRFDFATFGRSDTALTQGGLNEHGEPVTLQNIANERRTIGMNGSGFIEMLARQMTTNLQAVRNATVPGTSQALLTKGVSFGTLSRRMDGTWDTSGVQGLPAPSLVSTGADHPPSLVIMPFHQAGAVISLRQFTNNAFPQHHGMQPEERAGIGVDGDGDGFRNELTRADITAVTVYQATLPVPGRSVPDDPDVEEAVQIGEQRFSQLGCTGCHTPKLPLVDKGWIYTEPSPFNPAGNLRVGDAPTLSVDLTSENLPGPRLNPDERGVVWVSAFTDLKLHDITTGASDPNAEPLDQNQPAGTPKFFAGNTKFITRKLWGVGNSGPYMHHGKFTTMREAILAHSGEALSSRQSFEALPAHDRDCVVEFLKTLQVLASGSGGESRK